MSPTLKNMRSPAPFLLLVGLCSLTLLTGCADIKNPFGSQRAEQTVNGERRMPLYNTADLQKIAQPQAAPQPPSMLAPVPVAAPATSMGSLNPAPVKVDPSAPPRKKLPGRKPADVAPAPLDSAAPSADAPQQRPGFFDRVFGSGRNADASPPPWKLRDSASGISESEKNAPYAPLSSVPETPGEFSDIKANRAGDISGLQREHEEAQTQKRKLDSEPSQQQSATPVPMPKPEAAPATETARTPRRGIDIMTQEEWDAMQKTRQEQPPVAAPSDPVPAAAAENPHHSWWDGFRLKHSAQPETPKPEEQSPAPKPEPAAAADSAPSQLIGEISDKSIMQPPASEETPADASNLSPKAGPSDAAQHRSFFSRWMSPPPPPTSDTPVLSVPSGDH